MNKKGALELSINAIVILIIAITMLGLGLGFVRGMFGKASGQFDELTGAEPEPPIPSSSNPVTLSREVLIVSAGSMVALKVGFYNPTGSGITPAITITGSDDDDAKCGTGESSLGTAVDTQKSKVFTVLFSPAGTGTLLCKLKINGGSTYYKEFTMKVSS